MTDNIAREVDPIRKSAEETWAWIRRLNILISSQGEEEAIELIEAAIAHSPATTKLTEKLKDYESELGILTTTGLHADQLIAENTRLRQNTAKITEELKESQRIYLDLTKDFADLEQKLTAENEILKKNNFICHTFHGRKVEELEDKLTALESQAAAMQDALLAYLELSSHIPQCCYCQTALIKRFNLCDEHLRLCVKAMNLKDKALSSPSSQSFSRVSAMQSKLLDNARVFRSEADISEQNGDRRGAERFTKWAKESEEAADATASQSVIGVEMPPNIRNLLMSCSYWLTVLKCDLEYKNQPLCLNRVSELLKEILSTLNPEKLKEGESENKLPAHDGY